MIGDLPLLLILGCLPTSTNPVEMAMPPNAAAVQVVKSMLEYFVRFQTAFPEDQDPVTLLRADWRGSCR